MRHNTITNGVRPAFGRPGTVCVGGGGWRVVVAVVAVAAAVAAAAAVVCVECMRRSCAGLTCELGAQHCVWHFVGRGDGGQQGVRALG